MVLVGCSSPAPTVTYEADISIHIPATLTIDGATASSGDVFTFEFATLDELFSWTAHAVVTTSAASLEVEMKASNELLTTCGGEPILRIYDRWEVTDHTQSHNGLFFYAASGGAKTATADCGWVQ